METAEPVPYEFPAFVHRRPMDSSLFPYYSHPTTGPYSLPYQPPSSATYSYGSLNQPPHPYQYFMGQPPLPAPVRLTSEQQPLQPLPEIRPAKNAINSVGKAEHRPSAQVPGSPTTSLASPEKKPGPETDFSTEVDVLMKAIQSKANSSPGPSTVQQTLPPLQQQLAPTSYPDYAISPPRFLMTNEGQLSRSGKKRKYTCTLPDCGKSFAQKTHLDIHTRAHTGNKPFVSG